MPAAPTAIRWLRPAAILLHLLRRKVAPSNNARVEPVSANEVDAPAPEPPVVLRPAPVVGVGTDRTIAAWRLLCASRLQLATKRSIDIAGAAVALILLSPILLVTSLAILMTSPGGIFYTQTRVGRGGRPFTLIKFRTMQRGADALMERYGALNELDGPIFKIRTTLG